MQVVDIEPSNNEQIEEYIPPLPTEKKIKKLDERTKCDLCHQEMSLKTLRYSHAKNCKAQKIKEPPKMQEEEIQPTIFVFKSHHQKDQQGHKSNNKNMHRYSKEHF
jgi:hypothetical protein